MITKLDIDNIRSGNFTAENLHNLSTDSRLSVDAYIYLRVLPEIEKAILAGSFFIQLKLVPERDPDALSLIECLKEVFNLDAYIKDSYSEEAADAVLVIVRWVHAQ